MEVWVLLWLWDQEHPHPKWCSRERVSILGLTPSPLCSSSGGAVVLPSNVTIRAPPCPHVGDAV